MNGAAICADRRQQLEGSEEIKSEFQWLTLSCSDLDNTHEGNEVYQTSHDRVLVCDRYSYNRPIFSIQYYNIHYKTTILIEDLIKTAIGEY